MDALSIQLKAPSKEVALELPASYFRIDEIILNSVNYVQLPYEHPEISKWTRNGLKMMLVKSLYPKGPEEPNYSFAFFQIELFSWS